MIPVTKPFLPPYEEYEEYLKEIWKREHITNNGPLVKELEQRLKDYFRISNILFLSNGTIALQIAIKALDLSGEIITTPFSYVATTSSIVWEGCKPVFVDIDSNTLNISPSLIEAAITNKTTGILATHVFGNPCNIEAIQAIANKYNLKVIYDAAHCFGTKYKNKSVFEYGDVSTASFHATKLFHTVEGGAVFSKDEIVLERMKFMRNFGHDGPEKFNGVGINGKNSEFHAAMGLCNLDYMDIVLERRKKQCKLYEKLLTGLLLKTISIEDNSSWNYAYYPVIFSSDEQTLKVKDELEKNHIYPRRYFYPSLDEMDYIEDQKSTVSRAISQRILCLPLYHTLKEDEQNRIVRVIKNAI